MLLSVASLHLYPVKSLGGFEMDEAEIGDRGFVNDRRWMLVDDNGRFISQRENAKLALLHCHRSEEGFRVLDIRDGSSTDLPWCIADGDHVTVSVWDDTVKALRAPMNVSAWLAERLGQPVTLVYMPDSSYRPVDSTYATGITSLSDGFPYLVISQASLDDLNARLPFPVPMDRFRPNIVIKGGQAYQEDLWKDIIIGHARFALVKPCARCVITTTDQRTGDRGTEPLRTLATYRARNNGVLFGMNALATKGDVIRVGDLVNA